MKTSFTGRQLSEDALGRDDAPWKRPPNRNRGLSSRHRRKHGYVDAPGTITFDLDGKDITPSGFGRIAASTAKQVIIQKIRD